MANTKTQLSNRSAICAGGKRGITAAIKAAGYKPEDFDYSTDRFEAKTDNPRKNSAMANKVARELSRCGQHVTVLRSGWGGAFARMNRPDMGDFNDPSSRWHY